MPNHTEDRPLAELEADHIYITSKLGRMHNRLSTLRLHVALWAKANGRRAVMFAALLIGLVVLFTNNALLQGSDSAVNDLGLLVIIAVLFSSIWLVTNNDH